MPTLTPANVKVPFFRPSVGREEIDAVVACLSSGWLTSGPCAKEFEARFAQQVGASHAIAVNSCTAALHLAVEALGLRPGQGVLVPTMTFAATAEVVRYQGAIPILVDCHPKTLNLDLADAERKLAAVRSGRWHGGSQVEVVGIIPVHVGGLMLDINRVRQFAAAAGLWIVEDAAHAFPAAWRASANDPWQLCGQDTASVTCFSFYANKTITTGEGGMAVTADQELSRRMRLMSLHGLSHDAWNRYSGGVSWDYRIVEAGYKYNLTDIAASIGLCQLARAEELRRVREEIAQFYLGELGDIEQLALPPVCDNRLHAWHLFPIRLQLDRLSIDRNQFVQHLRERGVGCSVHWRPLHLHPYYQERCGWQATDCPIATTTWQQLVSLPLFSEMQEFERQHVVRVVRQLCAEFAVSSSVRVAVA